MNSSRCNISLRRVPVRCVHLIFEPLVSFRFASAPLLSANYTTAAVVIGTILDAKAFVSKDRTYVYSDFHVRIEPVLKQDSPANLTAGGQLVVSRGGGTIHCPSGRIRHYVHQREGMPAIRSRYLFFLTKANISEPEYEVIIGRAYELRNGTVSPA